MNANPSRKGTRTTKSAPAEVVSLDTKRKKNPAKNAKSKNPAPVYGERRENASNEHWYTPEWFFWALGFSKRGRHFAVDVCSPGAEFSSVPARVHLTEELNGLTTVWPDGLAYCNPPYAAEMVQAFLSKLADHPAGGLALVNNSSSTEWARTTVYGRATAMLLPYAKISFHNADIGAPAKSSNPWPSVVVAYGEEAAEILRAAAPRLGVFVPLHGIEFDPSMTGARMTKVTDPGLVTSTATEAAA